MLRVLLTDRAWPNSDIERDVLASAGAELIEADRTDEARLVELAQSCDAIATNWATVTERMMAASGKCRVVARMGIGLDNIDVAAASKLGIPVCNCPDYCISEVSDHALGLLLALARKIGFFHGRTKQGEYQLQAGPPLRRLVGQTLGLVGLGRTARALLPKAQSLGLKVIATTSSGNDYGTGIPIRSLHELVAESDYISVHAPLVPATRKLFSTDVFRRMKPSAYLINTSRGGLVDEPALKAALDAGLLAGAALDVFDPEPCDLSAPLFRDERVIVTPHAAFVSEESLQQMRIEAMEQVVQCLRGDRPKNWVNKSAFVPH